MQYSLADPSYIHKKVGGDGVSLAQVQIASGQMWELRSNEGLWWLCCDQLEALIAHNSTNLSL